MSPAPRNVRMQRALKYGFWARTKVPPYRAVRWEPEVREDGRQRLQGRCWVEILPNGVQGEPRRFLGEDITLASPTEPLLYAPAPDAPLCGWRLSHLMGYCPKVVEPGELCPAHAVEYTAYQEAENTAVQEEGEDSS